MSSNYWNPIAQIPCPSKLSLCWHSTAPSSKYEYFPKTKHRTKSYFLLQYLYLSDILIFLFLKSGLILILTDRQNLFKNLIFTLKIVFIFFSSQRLVLWVFNFDGFEYFRPLFRFGLPLCRRNYLNIYQRIPSLFHTFYCISPKLG